MRKFLMDYLAFWQAFGFYHGLKIYMQIKRNKIENIKIPYVKHPLFLRKNTSDAPTFMQVFVNREYHLKFDFIPEVIIDAGANIGLFTVAYKTKFPNAKIICIEPDANNVEIIKRNTSKYDNIYIENFGLWNKDVRLKITDKYNLGKWGLIVEEDSENGTVMALSIPTIMKKYQLSQIDLLKLDIETSEKQLFKAGYEEWLPKVKMIIIELHDWLEQDCSRPFLEAINKCFKSYKFAQKGENTIVINLDLVHSPNYPEWALQQHKN